MLWLKVFTKSRMTLKENIKELKHSNLTMNRVLFVCLKSGWHLMKIVIDDSIRSSFFTRITCRKLYHQRSFYTSSNRYPLIFKTCAEYLSSTPTPKILSLGCSTGEEVFSLLQYIPGATIVGVDVNNWCIKTARRNNKSAQCTFIHRTSIAFNEAESFDAIFCMAVFQRTENRTNKDNSQAKGFLFENFEKEVLVLDKKLKQGGLLVIDNADFSFNDTSISEKYSPLAFEGNRIERKRPLFDRHNHKVSNSHSSFRVFVKYSE